MSRLEVFPTRSVEVNGPKGALMFRSRRMMMCASVMAIALSFTGCKKVITSRVVLSNQTTNVTILSVVATAGPVVYVYNGNLLPLGGTVGPVSVSSLSDPGDRFPIKGTIVASVGGVVKVFPIPTIINNFQIGRTNTITLTGTYVTGASGEIVGVCVDTP